MPAIVNNLHQTTTNRNKSPSVPFEILYKISNPYAAKHAINEMLKVWRIMSV